MYIEFDYDVFEDIEEHFDVTIERRNIPRSMIGEVVIRIFLKSGDHFDLSSFKSNCAWLILSNIPMYSFKEADEIVTYIAEAYEYAGIMLSINDDQLRILKDKLGEYGKVLEDFNPHSDQNVHLFYKHVDLI